VGLEKHRGKCINEPTIHGVDKKRDYSEFNKKQETKEKVELTVGYRNLV